MRLFGRCLVAKIDRVGKNISRFAALAEGSGLRSYHREQPVRCSDWKRRSSAILVWLIYP